MFPTVTILGIRIHAVTTAQTLSWVEQSVGHRTPRQICTANPEFVMTAQRDAEFFRLLNAADLVIPDGAGLLWAARWTKQHLPERVAGSDLIYQLSALAAEKGWGVYLLGAAEGVAAHAAATLQTLYPGLRVVGTFAGTPSAADAPDILQRITSAKPDLLFVAYGAPAQDKWIARYKAELNVPVSLGIGGAFDFVTGVAQRAPRWVQQLNLEWLHRLWKQPWRAQRIFNAVVVFPLTVIFKREAR